MMLRSPFAQYCSRESRSIYPQIRLCVRWSLVYNDMPYSYKLYLVCMYQYVTAVLRTHNNIAANRTSTFADPFVPALIDVYGHSCALFRYYAQHCCRQQSRKTGAIHSQIRNQCSRYTCICQCCACLLSCILLFWSEQRQCHSMQRACTFFLAVSLFLAAASLGAEP